ncbi:MAG TPA: SdrD B-like domain-containing protein [Gemmataceae bacterium]|nr:SdrD B-like domain-containing protein [Gemmataceae bacterium]
MFRKTRPSVIVAPPVTRCEPLEPRRLLAGNPTDLDLSFSGDGKVVTDFAGADDVAHAVAVQADGKIVVAGEAQVTVNGVRKTAFAAVRYNPDGSLDDGSLKDTTPGDKFGVAGKFTRVVDLGGGSGAAAIAIQKDGKIILAGNSTDSGVGFNLSQWSFLRLNKDGTTDANYGKLGVLTTRFLAGTEPSRLSAIVLQPDGNLLAAGGLANNWALLRVTSGGAIDTTFGDPLVGVVIFSSVDPSLEGLATADFGGQDVATAIALDNVGNIVVAGNVGGNGIKQNVGVERFLPSGQPDRSFGVNGQSVFSTGTALSSDVGSLAVRPSGEIRVGFASQASNLTRLGGTVSFDNNGRVVGTASTSGKTSANGLADTPTDSLVLGGTSIASGQTPERFYVAQVGGSLENDVDFGSTADRNVAGALTVGPDGKIVQVGFTTSVKGGRNFAIARYLGTPTSGLGTIAGNVFADTDRDGVKDANEAGQASVRVFVDANNNNVFDSATERSVLSDASGNYKLPIAPGTYRVREIPPIGQLPSLPLATPGQYSVTVGARQTAGGIDFGNAPAVIQSAQTRITGSVFFDFDGDGTRDVQHPTEPDLVGRTVFLDLNRNGVLDANEPRTTTDGGGNYAFNGIAPGTYRVRDVLPAGFTHTNPAAGFFDVTVANQQTVVRRFGTTFADADDSISEVNQRAASQISVGGSVNAAIANVTDMNLVRFTVHSGQRVGFDVDRASGSSLNSLLRLFNAAGQPIASNDDAAAPGETAGPDSFLSFTFNAAGTFYVGVSNNQNRSYNPLTGAGDNGAGSTGAYKLSLINLP